MDEQTTDRAPTPLELHKNEMRDKYKPMRDLTALARAMKKVQEEKEKADAAASMINAEYDVLRLEVIPALMDEQGIENIRVEGVGRLGLTADLYVSVKQGEKEGFYKWLRKNKLGDLIAETINSSTLKAFVKGRLKAAKPVPSDLLNVTPYTRASITKA